MTAAERGFLLLSSRLGDPERHPLSAPQLRRLTQRAGLLQEPEEDRELRAEDLIALGYGRERAAQICGLLAEEEKLDRYLQAAKLAECIPLTRITPEYPLAVRKRLGAESPGCLWAKGDLSLLDTPKVALVGSRDLEPLNYRFAEEAGRQAALQGITLVSGNARGADRTAQKACLEAGGRVIAVVADELSAKSIQPNVLYLSEESFELPFTSLRALSRNCVIHSLGALTLVAQCGCREGGTWSGTFKNLRAGWSRVYCCDDGSEASVLLEQLGAVRIHTEQLCDFTTLPVPQQSFFEG